MLPLSHFSRVRLCANPMDSNPPGSSVHGILQTKILEWVAMPSSRGIFSTQGSNPGLWHCRQILYHWATREALSLVWPSISCDKSSLSTYCSFVRLKEIKSIVSSSYTHDISYLDKVRFLFKILKWYLINLGSSASFGDQKQAHFVLFVQFMKSNIHLEFV